MVRLRVAPEALRQLETVIGAEVELVASMSTWASLPITKSPKNTEMSP